MTPTFVLISKVPIEIRMNAFSGNYFDIDVFLTQIFFIQLLVSYEIYLILMWLCN